MKIDGTVELVGEGLRGGKVGRLFHGQRPVGRQAIAHKSTVPRGFGQDDAACFPLGPASPSLSRGRIVVTVPLEPEQLMDSQIAFARQGAQEHV